MQRFVAFECCARRVLCPHTALTTVGDALCDAATAVKFPAAFTPVVQAVVGMMASGAAETYIAHTHRLAFAVLECVQMQ
jgi:hypothetical protein